jgi:transposase-like protein
MTDLTSPIYNDENAARAHLESLRWPNGPVCPHCGSVENIAKVEGTKKSHRAGLYYCNACKGQFTVTVGTVFERSHVPLHKWVLAYHLLCSSKKGISSHQLHRMLGVTYKTAWFMSHRIRESMRETKPEGLGGSGKVVEADETYFGTRDNAQPSPQRKGRPFTKRGKTGPSGKRAVLGLVERGGKARTFHIREVKAENVANLVRLNLSRESALMTDESRLYTKVGEEFASHRTVTHSANEYVRDEVIHTNTIESYFSVFKRGMRGIYQHCGEAHLHRYLAEFDFRYNTRTRLGIDDDTRAAMALSAIGGKRLTYRQAD